MLKPGSQNWLVIKALETHKTGLTAKQLERAAGSTAVATLVSECRRKHGYNILNLKDAVTVGKRKHPVYILYEG